MKLGYIGIGLMGAPMTLRLLAAGHEVTVWNRSREKLAPVLAKGARAVGSPADVARNAEIVMMCVTDQRAAEEVLFGANGVAEGAKAGLVVVDFSSIAPASARAFHKNWVRKALAWWTRRFPAACRARKRARSPSWRAGVSRTSSALGRS